MPTTTVIADNAGRFAFSNLPASPAYYSLRAQHDGYSTVDSGLGLAEIRLVAGQNVRNVVLTLTTGGNVRGRVSDATGRPLPNVPIYVYQTRHEWDGRRGWMRQAVAASGSRLLNVIPPGAVGIPANMNRVSAEPIARTEPDGTYLLRSVPAGEYYFGVEYGTNSDGFASTYYPGVVDPTRATPIVIEPEADISGIDLRIQRPPRFKVSGRVENLNTDTSQPIRLAVRLPGSDVTIQPTLGNISVNPAEGRFEVSGIVPGSYELVANAGEATQRLSIELRDKDIENVLLRIPRTIQLQGSVRIEPRPGSVESAMPIGWSPVSDNGGPLPLRPFRLTREGPFSIINLNVGTYYLSFIEAPSGYTLDIRQGSRDVRNDGRFVVRENSDALSVVVRPADFGSIQGTVTTAAGKTLWSQVLLVPDEPRRENHGLYVYDNVKWGGRFDLQTITPGGYRLFAWEKERILGLSPYMDAATLAKYERYGVPITVRPNETYTVEVPLIP